MNAFLSGADSLKLTRLARRDPALRLVPCEGGVCRPAAEPVDPAALREALPQELSGFTAARPLSLASFSRETRSQSSLVDPRAFLARLPEGSFLEVIREDGTPFGSERVPVRLFVESPGISLVGFARRLLKLVRGGAISEDAAFVRLLSLAMEACGLYARDPCAPLTGECAYDVESVGSADDLRLQLGELSRLQGLRLAREVASYAKDGSGSPGETLLSLVMRLPPRRGGIPLPDFVENEPVEWPEDARDVVKHQTMRPDFHWPKHRVASEYNGGAHGQSSAYVEDSFRVQDYAACDIALVPATYDDIRNAASLERFVRLVAKKLAPHEDEGFLRRVADSIADQQARKKRIVLLGQLLPPDPRYSE
ncbi:MAG TPA: hypothetical protein IAA15_10505 [Candidatus Olsenella pullicola]|nr:hypothetical protein [Candidatus Olsenella pullicola]